jgi:hypothetical protein
VLLEDRGFKDYMAGDPLELEGVDDALGQGDLRVHAMEGELIPLGIALEETPGTGCSCHGRCERRSRGVSTFLFLQNKP